MKFSTGDPVLIRKTGEEGHVVALIGPDMAEINIKGAVFPIYLDEIDHPYLRWFTEKNKQARKKASLPEQLPVEQPAAHSKIASGIHMTFIPSYHMVDMEERVEKIKIYVLNETHYTVQLQFDTRSGDQNLFSYTGILQPFSDLYLHFADWNTMSAIPRFDWSLKETHSSQYAAASGSIKIKAARLFEHIAQLQRDNQPSFSYLLLDTFKEQVKQPQPLRFEQPVPVTKTAIRSIKDIPKYELDLHIEHLVDQVKGLSNADILQIQLAELQKYLRIAINNRQDKMVIIHGLGKGILREEVHKILKAIPEIANTESGWQPGFGFGATVVSFQYP